MILGISNELLYLGGIILGSMTLFMGGTYWLLNKSMKETQTAIDQGISLVGSAFGVDISRGQRQGANIRSAMSRSIASGEKILSKQIISSVPELDLIQEGGKLLGMDFNLKKTLQSMPPASLLGIISKYYPMLPPEIRERVIGSLPHLDPKVMAGLAGQGQQGQTEPYSEHKEETPQETSISSQ